MRVFKDAIGREWSVDVTLRAVKAVREATGGRVDLMLVASPEFGEQVSDPVVLADVLFAICSRQAKDRGVDAEQFGDGLSGDAIDAAGEVLVGAIADFFPSRQRKMLLAAMEAGAAERAKVVDQVTEEIMRPTGIGSPTGLPGSPVSTLAPSASDS